MRYCPAASVVTRRTFSISAGLLASTVTPGKTAPVASRTTPAIAPACCADTRAGNNSATTAARTNLRVFLRVISAPYMGPTTRHDGGEYSVVVVTCQSIQEGHARR